MTWRPRRTRVVAYALASVIMLGMIALAVAVPSPYLVGDRFGFVVVGAGIAWVLHMFARCRVVADERGLTVVNVFRTHRFEWAEVLGVSMSAGEPWPTLDLADGNSVGAMGIQGAEHAFAERATAELIALLHTRGEGAEPGG